FIHGMFQNAGSWDNWLKYFSNKGYQCIAESWPLHEGEPSELRNDIPPGLGDLRLDEVIDKFTAIVENATGDDRSIVLVGHSVGGLIVQSLLSKGYGNAGICISSVAPNKMLAFDWGFFRNSISIANPFKGDEPFLMTKQGFHQNFCNTMTRLQSDAAYEKTATHDSRNILRDCMMESGEIDLDNTNKQILFIAGEKDQIIPPELNKKNADAYHQGQASFEEFPNRGHFICNQPGWEEIVDSTFNWIEKFSVEVTL
ncbi:MAG TPA: alpha/beta fold hydrolase, partial [Chryseolinea sp.]|nr:alpha/beta fold hydrolase [Chryseolinea sp.]